MKTIALIEPPHDLKKYEEWKSQWLDVDSIGIANYISECCHPEDFLICSQLLIPSFIEVENSILIKERYQEENFLAWKKYFSGEMPKVEKMLNNITMYDVFLHTGNDVSNVIFEQICNMMKISWRLILKELFPCRQFIIEVYLSTQDDGPSITFYQKNDIVNN